MDFKDYIFKKLRWPLCMSSGPIAVVVHGLARVFNDVVMDINWLRDQFNPATCENQFVQPLAESRGIKRHRLETDDNKFRQRVVKAFAWQLLGGKSAGMPVLLKHFGYETEEPVNLRSEDQKRWAEFRINLTTPISPIQQDDFELLGWAINESKPARSKLASIRVAKKFFSNVYIRGYLRKTRTRTIYPADLGPTKSGPASVYIGGAVIRTRIRTIRSV
ncbi:phage tail protein [Maridesulfovibrio bastinii]|uniref:phage tail protein n=1 Tax=Maridesulfovibrio bastinii TaxID=47157 RepID=UPI00040383A1|nr:phage tail protein [Maridesulfovibrio bastinii]